MNTSSLIVEFIIIGFQTITWIILTVFSFLGHERFNLGPIYGVDGAAAFILVMIPIVYPFGILMDHLADEAMKRWHNSIRDKYIESRNDSYVNFVLKFRNDKFSEYMEYGRTKIRLGRSSFLNFSLITIIGSIFILSGRLQFENGDKSIILGLLLVFGTLLSSISLWTWHSGTNSYYKNLRKAFDSMK